ncbi:MAG: CDP-alcohol phosphatidyltransferase family protein [Candidatus Gallimonas sp.]
MANFITGFRAVCAIVLLPVRTFSVPFYLVYATAGISDMLDGFVARRTKTASTYGAKIDGIADFILTAVCIVKILPRIPIPGWLSVWIAGIALIKCANYLFGTLSHKQYMLHTVANKTTGFLLFLTPFFVNRIALPFIAIPLCIVATFAAAQEGYLIATSDRKSILPIACDRNSKIAQ